MRRCSTIFLVIVMIIVFSACSNKTSTPKLLIKEGVAPYELSESDTYLLKSLGIEKDVSIISFKAPKAAKSLKVNAYVLNDNDTWNVAGGIQVYLGQDGNSNDRLEGTFTMMLKDDYAIDFNVNMKGKASFHTDTLDIDNDIVASSHGFLKDFQSIQMNKEIPVALMIYDGDTKIRSYAMEDFFSPTKFEDMDLVQAVTLIFTDETN